MLSLRWQSTHGKRLPIQEARPENQSQKGDILQLRRASFGNWRGVHQCDRSRILCSSWGDPTSNYQSQSCAWRQVCINGKEVRVLFDTGTIGTNLITAAFVTTHGISCKEMENLTKIHIAMKGSRPESQKDCIVNITPGSFRTKGTKMIVGDLAKYDALIGMPFLNEHKATIECRTLCIYFPEHKVRINYTPTSPYVCAAVASTLDIMNQHPEVFPETIPEVLRP